MTVATRKFNPGFLTEDELVASFCVRIHEFESIVETLRGCTGNSNQHQIVIGPRGSGKTTLLLRVAAKIGRDTDLSSRLLPVRFAEECYEVSTAGEFWLECLSQISNQAPSEEYSPDLPRTLAEFRTIQDDRTLADRCLGALLDYADHQGKRLVLLVENLNMMFRDMADPDAGWRLRHTLQTESRIVLLASATSRFEEIDSPDSALYELLRVHTLAPLATDECVVLWEAESGESPSRDEVRPLEILTGGSPRLLTIVARMGAGRSLGDLLDHLLDLIDDHTEYFKSHIEALPAQERRVYLALAELWEPATTKEVAGRARLDTNKCSAQLKRLSDRGAVRVVGGSARRKQFYLTERLFNIYYLLRRRRGPDRPVRALLRFMSSYYSGFELAETTLEFVKTTTKPRREVNPLRAAAMEQLPGVALADVEGTGYRWDRPREALVALDEAMRRFENSNLSEADDFVLATFTKRGLLLWKLGHEDAARAAFSDALKRLVGEQADGTADWRARLRLLRGHLELDCQEYGSAREIASELLAHDRESAPDYRCLAFLLRARSALLDAPRSAESDLAAALDMLPALDSLPSETFGALAEATVELGAARILELIDGSASAELLLPLTTALELELGRAPRVAREVEEVAKDIRLSLAKTRRERDAIDGENPRPEREESP